MKVIKLDLKEKLERLETARDLISQITRDELRDDIICLSGARESIGALDVSIQHLKKDVVKGTEQKFSNIWVD